MLLHLFANAETAIAKPMEFFPSAKLRSMELPNVPWLILSTLTIPLFSVNLGRRAYIAFSAHFANKVISSPYFIFW